MNNITAVLLFILWKHNGLTGLYCCAPGRDVFAQRCHLSKLLSSWDSDTENMCKYKENGHILAVVLTFLGFFLQKKLKMSQWHLKAFVHFGIFAAALPAGRSGRG